MLRFPRLPDCTTCQKYVVDYDWQTGQGTGKPERAKDQPNDPEALYERPAGNRPPCQSCPKQGPANERLFRLSKKNWKTFLLWQQTRSTFGRGLSELEARDAVLRRNFSILDGLMRKIEQESMANAIASAVRSAVRNKR